MVEEEADRSNTNRFQDQINDIAQDSNNTQEQRTRESDAALHLGQVFLGWCPAVHTRDLCADFLQILTIILLGEHHISIEEGETYHHQEIQQIVDPASRH